MSKPKWPLETHRYENYYYYYEVSYPESFGSYTCSYIFLRATVIIKKNLWYSEMFLKNNFPSDFIIVSLGVCSERSKHVREIKLF